MLSSLVGSETITDFMSGSDKLRVSQGRYRAIPVQNGDSTVENAAPIAGPGGFATNAELIVVTGSISGAIASASAAAAIGSASSSYAIGQKALFMVDNAVGSALYLFSALNADAAVGGATLPKPGSSRM